MTLRIAPPTWQEGQKAFSHLQVVCRDVAESITLDPATGEVLFHQNAPEGTASSFCTALAQDQWEVVIIPRFDAERMMITDSWVTQPSGGVGGATHPLCTRGVMAFPSASKRIDLPYDALDYPSGQGYRGHDLASELQVAAPHLLAFGIGAAGQIAYQLPNGWSSGTPWRVDPNLSLHVENLVRASASATLRVGPLEFYLPTCSETPGNVWTPPAKKPQCCVDPPFPCFVATAAYGSPLAPEVQMLREFRDTVLRRTRTGEEWFERFYRRYDEVSQPLAARMREDPELAELLRVGIVQPYVGWLELAQRMPEAPLDEVPEPWREFLALLIDRMDAWASEAMPDDLDGLDGLAAARELAVVLRYGFRDHGRRSAYLDRLTAAGALPLRLSGIEAREARGILLGAGLPRSHVTRVVAEAPKGARRKCSPRVAA